MKKSLFIALMVAAVIAVLLAWQLGLKPRTAQPIGGDVVASGELLLPQFESIANDIDSLEIIGAGNTPLVTLQRSDKGWVIAQRDGYVADWPEVRGLLRQLGQAKVIAPKTAREALYSRLGVADVSTENTGGGLLRWGEQADQALIIGIEAADLTGRYVRQPGNQQSYLVDQSLEVKTDPADWIEKGLIDWQSSRFQRVTIRHADADLIQIERTEPDALEMSLINIPEGREISGQWAVNGIVNGLISLRADDVRKVDSPLPDFATRALFVTENGINLVMSLYQQEPESAADADDSSLDGTPQYLVRMDVSIEPVNTDASVVTDDQDSETSTSEQESVSVAEGDTAENDPTAEAGQLQQKLEGWEFVIPDYKFNAINKRLEDLLKPLPEVEEAADG